MNINPICREYNAVMTAASKKEYSHEIVQRAKYTLYDLLCVQDANNEGCIMSRPASFAIGAASAVGTMALAIAAMLLPWSEFAIEGLEAIVPWLPVEVVMFAVFVGVIAVIMATVTVPVMRLVLKGWMRRKIRRLKRAIAKMPKELVCGWSFMEPDRQRATG